MVRSPCFDSNGMKKGAWSKDEDNKLRAFVLTYGHRNWRLLPKYAGLKRCGKSCRLRWVNHLKPGVKRGNFSKEEEDLIIKLHAQLGNKWSAIAAELPGRAGSRGKAGEATALGPRPRVRARRACVLRAPENFEPALLPGRTDNDIKNFWHTRISPRRKPNPPPNEQASPIDPNQSADSFDATSLIKFEQPTPAVFRQPQMNLGFDEFVEDRNGGGFALLVEDEFCYGEVNYFSELSNESLDMDVLDWIRDGDYGVMSDGVMQGSIWEESYGLSSLWN